MSLQNYLNTTMSSFIRASISRVADTGDMSHRYRMTAQDVKDAAQLQRLHDTAVSEYLRNNFNVEVFFDKGAAVFLITIDLSRVMLNPTEAEFLNVALATYRQAYG